MNNNFSEFEEHSGVVFINKDLLRQAFLHRSYLNEHPKEPLDHNERLEFLGDAVLELVTTAHLYHTFPDKPEGELTAYRAALVNTQSISQAAQTLGMNDFLLLSKGERSDTGKARSYILADTFEAMIGAIYLDQGYDVAADFITRHLLPSLDTILTERLWQDSKSHLQEKAQDKRSITPEYRVLHETGPDHDKVFTMGVFLEEEQIGEGKGSSKQEAQQSAADDALRKQGWLKE